MGVRQAGQLLSIGGLKQISPIHGELKSMHTLEEARGRGAGREVLRSLVDHARKIGLEQISLETGSAALFAPAHRLYRSEGFEICPPFGDYEHDPLSLFMTRKI